MVAPISPSFAAMKAGTEPNERNGLNVKDVGSSFVMLVQADRIIIAATKGMWNRCRAGLVCSSRRTSVIIS
jgi:hypothetical protein